MLLELKKKFIFEHHKKGFSPPEIFKLGKKIEINRMLIKRTIDQFEEISSITDRPRSGRPRSSRTPNLIKSVKEKIRHNPRKSMRKMAKESKISPRTMRRICHNDFKMSPYKLQKRQLISGPTIEKRLARSKNYCWNDSKMARCKILSLVMRSYSLCNRRTITKMIEFWKKP